MIISKKKLLREVYVWELPVRIFHWTNAVCIVVLCITGYIIGNPPAIQHATAPEFNYWFGWVRFAHFVAAFVFMLNFLVRFYWAFVGNSFARWRNYLPLTRRQWRGIFDTIRVDILLLSPKPLYDIGHNSLAAFTYFGLFVLFIIQSLTGMAMFFVSTDSVLEPMFTGLLLDSGGFFIVRDIHHIAMWGFILFSIVHIYLVFYHDYIERNGIASSIIGGWKFIPEELAEEYELEQQEQQWLRVEEKVKSKKKKAYVKAERKKNGRRTEKKQRQTL